MTLPLRAERTSSILLRLRAWYVACIMWGMHTIGSGCLYIEPTWRGNVSPEIFIPDNIPGQVIEQPIDLPILSVVARDPDSDQFWCLWQALGQVFPGDTCDKEPGDPLIYSTFRLDLFDPEEIVGRTINVSLWDEESSANITFQITPSQGVFE